MSWLDGIRKDREMIERMVNLQRERDQMRQLAMIWESRYNEAQAKLAEIRDIINDRYPSRCVACEGDDGES
jgi:hypothetical protein